MKKEDTVELKYNVKVIGVNYSNRLRWDEDENQTQVVSLPVMHWTLINSDQYNLLMRRKEELAQALGYDSIIVLVEGVTNQNLTDLTIEQVDKMLAKLEQERIERQRAAKEREANKRKAAIARQEKKELEILKKAEEIKAKLSKNPSKK